LVHDDNLDILARMLRLKGLGTLGERISRGNQWLQVNLFATQKVNGIGKAAWRVSDSA
jgi:hypothetical protein